MNVLLDRLDPACVAFVEQAAGLIQAARAINAQVMLPEPTSEHTNQTNALAFALQAVLQAAREDGMTEKQLFSAQAVLVGGFLRGQNPAAIDEIAARFAKACLLTATWHGDATPYDLNAGGRA